MKIAILYSSGLDSFIMRKLAEHEYPAAEIVCVYYEHGADSEAAEIQALPKDVQVRKVDWLGDTIQPVTKKGEEHKGNIYIPGRNLVFITLVACQELPDRIWLGPLIDECNDGATDKNYQFKSKVEDTINYAVSPFKSKICIEYPLADRKWTKSDAVRWAYVNGRVTREELASTTSCWHNVSGKHCGECFQCFKRYLVMRDVFGEDIDSFDVYPPTTEAYLNMVNILENKIEYDCNADELNMKRMIRNVQRSRNGKS